jgi:uncharacterized protein
MPETSSSFLDKLQPAPQKKLLALDGGGIRGVLTLEILAAVEEIVRQKLARPDAVLADYFDYIAGTSTGAIIGTCLALGMSVKEVRAFYINNGPPCSAGPRCSPDSTTNSSRTTWLPC